MADKNYSDNLSPLLITVVIVTYQSVNTIKACLDGFKESIDDNFLKVVIIDNNSSDGTAALINSEYDEIKVIENRVNIGFGRGCNYGIAYADTPYILLINPDAAINHDSLKTLTDFMDMNPDVGICGPAVVDSSGALQPSGASAKPWKIILKPIFPGLASRGMRKVVPGEEAKKTDWICGSVMLLRRKMIDDIGGFDPRFFLYFEETDMHQRAMNAGWQIWTVGKAVGTHINAASAKETSEEMIWGTISEHYFKSRFYFLKKHYGFAMAVFAEIGELCTMIIRFLADKLRRRTYYSISQRFRAPILKTPAIPELIDGEIIVEGK